MAEKNLCSNCGAPVPEGAALCPYCNTPIERDHKEETNDLQSQALQALKSGHLSTSAEGTPVTIHKTANQQTVAFFLGSFGVHDFMLGNPVHGGIKLGLTLLSVGVLSWVSGLWALIDMVEMENHKYKCGPGHVLEGKGCVRACLALLLLLGIICVVLVMAGAF